VSAVIARASVAPVHLEPSLRTEQVTQLVLGETAEVLAVEGTWLRVRTVADQYEGWAHRGYLLECDAAAAARWRAEADGWSEGAEVDTPAGRRRLPVRARAALEHGRVRLPDGVSGSLVQGHILPMAEVARAAAAVPAERWAAQAFAGVRYEWGGVTECGVDCSGLVQTTFAARGVSLPRDSAAQSRAGEEVALEAVRPGDLLFFSENGRSVSHVAFAATGDCLVHSTVSCGGVLTEPWTTGHRAAQLRAQFVTARRIPGAAPA
jgi:cell wall-associated NlpC family hydrolase